MENFHPTPQGIKFSGQDPTPAEPKPTPPKEDKPAEPSKEPNPFDDGNFPV